MSITLRRSLLTPITFDQVAVDMSVALELTNGERFHGEVFEVTPEYFAVGNGPEGLYVERGDIKEMEKMG